MSANNCVRVFLLLLASLFFSCYGEDFEIEKVPITQDSAQNLKSPFSTPQIEVEVSPQQAIEAVQRINNTSLKSIQNTNVQSIHTLYTSVGEPALYVVNYTPEGYAIISATRKYTPIIAHNSEGSISLDVSSNYPIHSLLEGYVKDIEYVRTLPDSLTRQARLQWEMLGSARLQELRSIDYNANIYRKISEAAYRFEQEGYRVYRYVDLMGNYIDDMEEGLNTVYSGGSDILTPEIRRDIYRNVKIYASKKYNVNNHVLILLKDNSYSKRVGPLVTSTWGQGYYPRSEQELGFYLQRDEYNMYIPNYYLVGCVPVAVAQIMKYHRYPNQFDWSAMPDKIPTKETAKFLYEVARGVKTKFGADGSVSNSKNAEAYFKQQGYLVEKVNHNHKHKYHIITKLERELDNGRPVYVRGAEDAKKNGHAFILDGYYNTYFSYEIKVFSLPDAPYDFVDSQNLDCIYSKKLFNSIQSRYHINLGWYGMSDGYYLFDNFNTYNQQRGYLLLTPSQKR